MEFKPLVNGSRIESVDALRGFALFGVLIANIPFADENFIVGNWDKAMVFLYHFLVDKKFITIFSMLFGFGFYIQMKRAEEKKIDFSRYFSLRMLLLFVIGALHTYLLWNGDILRSYAFGGLLLLMVRNWPLKRLIVTAALFSVLLTGIFFIGNSALGWQVYNYDYALANERVLTNSYLRYLVINAIMDPWVNFFKDMPITLVFTFGNMLIGFIIGKTEFFSSFQKWTKISNCFIALGATFGLASSFLLYKITIGELDLGLPLLWVPFVIIVGILLQSMMYMCLVLKAFQLKVPQKFMQPFVWVGKMALSNYIFQTMLYVLVFFHCTSTFMLFGKLTIAETFAFGILFFLFQSILSYLWRKKHAQGPLEYLWKKISYGMAMQKKQVLYSRHKVD